MCVGGGVVGVCVGWGGCMCVRVCVCVGVCVCVWLAYKADTLNREYTRGTFDVS